MCRRRQARPACRPRWRSLGRAGVRGCCPATLPPRLRRLARTRARDRGRARTCKRSRRGCRRTSGIHREGRSRSRGLFVRLRRDARACRSPSASSASLLLLPGATSRPARSTTDDASFGRQSKRVRVKILAFVLSAICPFVDHSVKLNAE